MVTVNDMLKRFQSIDLKAEISNIIDRTSQDLIQLNQSQLFDKGVNADNEELQPYTFLTEFYKREKGQPFDRTTLKDTGAFYAGFNIKTSDQFIIFDSTDSKTSDLEQKYGNRIFGLTPENKTVYSFGTFYDNVKRYISQKTGLSFS